MGIEQRKAGIFNKWDIWAALAGAASACVYLVVSIFQSTNSTSVIGFIYLPFAAFIGGFLGFLSLWVFRNVYEVIFGSRGWLDRQSIVSYVLLIFLVSGVARYRYEREALLVASGGSLESAQLEEMFFRDYLFLGDEVKKILVQQPLLTERIQRHVAEGNDSYLIGLMGRNPVVTGALLERIVNEPPSYERQFGIAENANLTESQMIRLLAVRVEKFSSPVEYRLYQNFVMAPILRRKDVTERAYSSVSDIAGPETFLLYALLESPHLKCENFKSFSSTDNPVVLNAIQEKFQALGCK